MLTPREIGHVGELEGPLGCKADLLGVLPRDPAEGLAGRIPGRIIPIGGGISRRLIW